MTQNLISEANICPITKTIKKFNKTIKNLEVCLGFSMKMAP